MSTPPIVIVAAMSAEKHVIGNENSLLWHIPDDLKRFKELTLGHPIIMGRKTFESILQILGKPLPSRTNIVVTRNRGYQAPDGVRVVHSLEEALDAAKEENPKEIHIGGGAELYKKALPIVSRLHVTFVYDEPSGDTYFPSFEKAFTKTLAHDERVYKNLKYQWVDFERIT